MTYNGQWRYVDGQMVRDGIGKLKMKDGGIYEGMFVCNMMQGVGRMTHATGDMYQGEWHENSANGHGMFKTQVSTYEGGWLND